MALRFLAVSATTLACLLSPGCGADVVVHPPAVEQRYVSPFPPPLESYLAMSHRDAGRSIVSGVGSDLVGDSRWTQRRAVLQFHSIPLEEMRFHAAFVLPDLLMRRARRVILKVSIGDALVHEEEYDDAGPQEIQMKIPKGEVSFARDTKVVLEMTAPPGRLPDSEIRYLLTSAGFRF